MHGAEAAHEPVEVGEAELLRRRVLSSHESFSTPVDAPGGESYLLVLEDLETGRVAGTCGMVSKVGGFEPFYSYRIETRVHQSAALGVRAFQVSRLRP